MDEDVVSDLWLIKENLEGREDKDVNEQVNGWLVDGQNERLDADVG